MVNVVAAGVYILRVDQVDRYTLAHIVEQSRSGIDVHGGANDDEDVGLAGNSFRFRHHGDWLAKPDDMGPQLESFLTKVAREDVAICRIQLVDKCSSPVERLSSAHHGGGAPCYCRPVRAVVDVLGDDMHIEIFLHRSQYLVSFIGTGTQ